jgi:hypothetical protein
MSSSELRLVDDEGVVVLASIIPRCRWLGDGSLKWVTVHFLANVPAHGIKKYRIVASSAAIPKSPLQVMQREGKIVVITGPAKFVIPTDRLAPFEQVYIREDASSDFTDQIGFLAKPANFVLRGRNGRSLVRDGDAEVVGIDEPFTHTTRVESTRIEEHGPARVVIALRGTFSTDAVKSLDFTGRLYFYANSPLAQMTFSVRNRQLDDMAHFVGINQLAVEIPIRMGGDLFASIDVDGRTVEQLVQGSSLKLLQPARNELTVALPDGSALSGERSGGWVELRSEKGLLTAGNRWFWQTYPKGLEIRPDGIVALQLKPQQGDRVDLYTAGAKTHFLFFYFSEPGTVDARSIAAGTQFPLVAASDPDWYCEESVAGELGFWRRRVRLARFR